MQIFEENNTITLTFGNTIQISNVASDIFTMKDPDIFGKPIRLGRTELEKKFKHL